MKNEIENNANFWIFLKFKQTCGEYQIINKNSFNDIEKIFSQF